MMQSQWSTLTRRSASQPDFPVVDMNPYAMTPFVGVNFFTRVQILLGRPKMYLFLINPFFAPTTPPSYPLNSMTPPMSAQEKELALGATFYKEFARSVDNASRLIFPSSFSFKTNLVLRQSTLIYTKHDCKFQY